MFAKTKGGIYMKIVNIKKFIKMLVITAAIIVAILLLLTSNSLSKGEIKTKTFCVSSGDTLWSIASFEQSNNDYYKNKDIRQIIYELQKLNNIENNTDLKIGQKLDINCY